MTGYDPTEALAEIERTQQKAYREQRLPLWYGPGVVIAMTFGYIGLDAESHWVGVPSALGATALIGGLLGAVLRKSRVQWTASTWSVPAMLVYAGWLVLAVATAYGVHALAAPLDEPWRKLLAGAVTAVLLLVTTRPMENLTLHYSKGRVAK